MKEMKIWTKIVSVIAAFALVFSMVPLVPGQVSKTAVAVDESGESQATGFFAPWDYYDTKIYTDKTTETRTTNTSDIEKFQKDLSLDTRFIEALALHVLKNMKNDNGTEAGGTNVYDDSAKVTELQVDRPVLNDSGKGTISSESENLTISNGVAELTSYSETVSVKYTSGEGSKISFFFTGPVADRTYSLGVNVTATINSDGKISFEIKESYVCPETLSTTNLTLPYDTKSIKVVDVKTTDSDTLKNATYTVDSSFVGDPAKIELPDTLIYENYKFYPIDNEYFSIDADGNFTRKKVGGPTEATLNIKVGDEEGVFVQPPKPNLNITTKEIDSDTQKINYAIEKGINVTYKDAKTDFKISGLEKYKAEITDKTNDYYDITFKGGTLTIHGKKATTTPVSTSINFYVDGTDADFDYKTNNSLGTFTFNVTVKPREITIDKTKVPELPYRGKSDQIDKIKSGATDYASGKADEDSWNDIFETKDIDIVNYPNYSEATADKDVTVTGIKIKEDNANYVFGETHSGLTSISVKIKKIEEKSYSENYAKNDNFTLKGMLGDGNYDSAKNGRWVNSNVTAKLKDYQLSEIGDNKEPTGYKTEVTLSESNSGSQGANTQNLYAKDSDKVITTITGIAFNIDTTPPQVDSFSSNVNQARKDDTLIDSIYYFFFNNSTIGKVEMAASDSLSGLNTDFKAKVTMTKNDKEQTETRDIELNTDDSGKVDKNSGKFWFELDAKNNVEINEQFKVSLTDNALNTNDDATASASNLPENVWRLIQNNNAPTINVDFGGDKGNGRYYDRSRTVTVTITADHFDLIQQYDADQKIIEWDKTGSGNLFVTPAQFKNIGGTTWQYSETFSEDADYNLKASIKDLAGQSDNGGSFSWTIDKTNPSVNVVWDNENATNGNYYSAARTATVTITEHNFDAGEWSVSPTGDGGNASEYGTPSTDGWTHYGDTHITHVTFPGQGRYSMTIEGNDAALNALQRHEVSEFVVDTVQPEISVSVNGETDASSHAYPDNANVSIAIDDTNVDPASSIDIESISWNGSGTPYTENRNTSNTQMTVEMPNPENVAESDGVYRVTVNAQDLAGNTMTKTIDWSVNRFGSTYVVSDSTKGIINKKYVKGSDMSDVVITEINPSGVNEESATAKIAVGTNTENIEKGQGFTFASAAEQNGWPAFSYTISKDKYSSDAMYQTIVSSTDSAGRASDNTMSEKNETRQNSADVSFAVDNTSPIVSYSGFEENTVAGTSHTVKAYIEDNMKLDHAVVEVNGKQVKTLDEDDLKNKTHEITLSESGDNQVVTVKAYDAAGNMTPVSSSEIFVSNDFFARLMHNPAVFAATIIGLVLLCGAGVWFFGYYRGRKNKDEAQPTKRAA